MRKNTFIIFESWIHKFWYFAISILWIWSIIIDNPILLISNSILVGVCTIFLIMNTKQQLKYQKKIRISNEDIQKIEKIVKKEIARRTNITVSKNWMDNVIVGHFHEYQILVADCLPGDKLRQHKFKNAEIVGHPTVDKKYILFLHSDQGEYPTLS